MQLNAETYQLKTEIIELLEKIQHLTQKQKVRFIISKSIAKLLAILVKAQKNTTSDSSRYLASIYS